MTNTALQYLNDYDEGSADQKTLVLPEQPKTEAMPSNTDSVLQFLNKQDSVNNVKIEVDAIPKPEFSEDELIAIQTSPTPEVTRQNILSRRDMSADQIEAEDLTRLEKVNKRIAEDKEFIERMSEEEYEAFGQEIKRDLRLGEEMREADPFSRALSYLPTKTLLGLGNVIQKGTAATTDEVEDLLSSLRDSGPLGQLIFKGIDKFAAGGRYGETEDPADLADRMGNYVGAILEFAETVPAVGTFMASYNKFMNTASVMPRRLRAGALKSKKEIELAKRYNFKGAELATLESAEAARKVARETANANRELSSQMIREFEEKTGKTISKDIMGNLVYDQDAARKAGQETAREITERDGALFDLALGDDTIT